MVASPAKSAGTLHAGGGRIVRSNSLVDEGQDPLESYSLDENIMRLALGDIAFVGRFDRKGRLVDVYFAPEYPNWDIGALDRAITFYAIPLSQPFKGKFTELHVADPSLSPIAWDRAMEYLRAHAVTGLSAFQRATLKKIAGLDDARGKRKPNLTHEEMRKRIGPARGVRLSIKPILMGHV